MAQLHIFVVYGIKLVGALIVWKHGRPNSVRQVQCAYQGRLLNADTGNSNPFRRPRMTARSKAEACGLVECCSRVQHHTPRIQ
jgi:hypothetical protein